LLSLFFYLLAIKAFIEGPFLQNSLRTFDRKGILGHFTKLALFFILALLSKTIACTLPVVCMILFWWKGNPKLKIGFLKQVVPLFFIGLSFGLLTLYLEKNVVLAVGDSFQIGGLNKVLNSANIFFFYLKGFFWPDPIIFIYPKWVIEWNVVSAAKLLILVGLMVFICIQILKGKSKGFVSAVLIYSINLAPALGFFSVYFMVYAYVQDHFSYYASVSVFASMGFVYQLIQDKMRPYHQKLLTGIVVLLLIRLALMSFNHSQVFFDNRTLWLDTYQKNPKSTLAIRNLGIVYAKQAEWDLALPLFEKYLEHFPGKEHAYHNLGNVLIQTKAWQRAQALYQKGTKYFPQSTDVWLRLSQVYLKAGARLHGIKTLEKAITRQILDARLWVHLAEIHMQDQNNLKAKAVLIDAVHKGIQNKAVYYNLGHLHVLDQDYLKGKIYFQKALALDPGLKAARINLKYCLTQLEKT